MSEELWSCMQTADSMDVTTDRVLLWLLVSTCICNTCDVTDRHHTVQDIERCELELMMPWVST
jgi:hypothetical protein